MDGLESRRINYTRIEHLQIVRTTAARIVGSKSRGKYTILNAFSMLRWQVGVVWVRRDNTTFNVRLYVAEELAHLISRT